VPVVLVVIGCERRRCRGRQWLVAASPACRSCGRLWWPAVAWDGARPSRRSRGRNRC